MFILTSDLLRQPPVLRVEGQNDTVSLWHVEDNDSKLVSFPATLHLPGICGLNYVVDFGSEPFTAGRELDWINK